MRSGAVIDPRPIQSAGVRTARTTFVVTLMRLALLNVLRNRARTAMSLIAIALGVAAIIVAGGFIHDVYIQFAESIIHSHYGHFQVHRSGYSARGVQRPADYVIEDSSVPMHLLKQTAGVDVVLRRLRFMGLANTGGADVAIVGEGVEPELENRLGTFVVLVEGRLLNSRDVYSVIVGDGVAKSLHVRPGDRITLNVVTSEGALNSLEFDVVGTFRTHSKEFDARAVRLPLKAAQDLLATRGVNEVVVGLVSTSSTEALASDVESKLVNSGFEVKTWRDLADFYNKTVRLFERQFGFLQTVLLLMILLSVANTMNTAIFERLPEFGTMLALGDSRRDVIQLIMLECLIHGILGCLIGLALGISLALAVSSVGIPMPPPPNSDVGYTALVRIVPIVLLQAFVVGTFSAVLAGMFPSMRLARIDVVDALRQAK